MRLLITTPTGIIVDEAGVTSVRAEDGSGGFGILKGHADFLTALSISIIGWQDAAGGARYCAVRCGVLSVTGGDEVAIATREAIPGHDLDRLEVTVLDELRKRTETERISRAESVRLQMKAIRQIVHYLRPDRKQLMEGGS